jgi:LysM repeat protein
VLIRLLILLIVATSLVAGGYYAVQELYIKPERRLLADKKLPPPLPPPDPSIAEFERCLELRRNGAIADAKTSLERFLKEFPESRKRNEALDAIGEINSIEFFSQKPDETNTYVVESGDSISRIASRRKVPIELIVHLNKLESDSLLQPGQRVIAPHSEFRVMLDQKKRLVVLYNGLKFFRQYPTVSWPGMNKNPPVFLPKANGRLMDKAALTEQGAVKPTDKEYFTANHILHLSIGGHSLYSQPDDPTAAVHRPAGGGIGLAPALMNEIAILLPRGTPVTLD